MARLLWASSCWVGWLLASWSSGKDWGSPTSPTCVPWGLWITIDLSSIALGAGAFSLCAGVYLFGLKRYQPIARTATFVGLIGYTMATLALILDIGKPERFWHSMVYWNTHSLLWEVTMCVILYLTVLMLEAMPIIANLEWLRKRLPKIAALDVTCSSLCADSLRSLVWDFPACTNLRSAQPMA